MIKGLHIRAESFGVLLVFAISLAASARAEPRSIKSLVEEAYQKNPELHFTSKRSQWLGETDVPPAPGQTRISVARSAEKATTLWVENTSVPAPSGQCR